MSNDGPDPKAPITPAFDNTQPKKRITYEREVLLEIKEKCKDLKLSKKERGPLKKCGIYVK
ncbi:MAG: hypothetical protein AB7V32_00635 [Candidatus Berkiella sp.]